MKSTYNVIQRKKNQFLFCFVLDEESFAPKRGQLFIVIHNNNNNADR